MDEEEVREPTEPLDSLLDDEPPPPEDEEVAQTITEEDAPQEPTSAEDAGSSVYRPQVNANLPQTEIERLTSLLGEEGLRDLRAVIAADLMQNRQSEVVADHYAAQVDAHAPGFIGVQERALLRQLPPEQQSNPGAAFLVAVNRYMQEAQTTGNVVGAIDRFVSDWQARTGKPAKAPAAPAPVLPAGQRGITAGTAVRQSPVAARTRDSEFEGAVSFLKSLDVDDTEARRYAREL